MRLWTPKFWSIDGLKEWYDHYHDNTDKTKVDIEEDRSRVVFQSKYDVMAKASLTSTSANMGTCQVWINI